MKRRRGYTLIELIATMSMMLAVLTLLSISLSVVMKNQSSAGEHLLAVNSQQRLARQFREDVHAARQLLPLDAASPGVQLRLDLGGFETQYINESGVERVELAEGAVRRREVFQVQPRGVLFESDGEPGGLIRMKFAKPQAGKPPAGETQRELVVEATMGSDRRFERAAP